MSLIPMVIEQEGRAERAMDIYSCLLKDRIIMVSGEVNTAMAEVIKAQLLYLASQDSQADIRMYINSPGGSVVDGLAIYDTMQLVAPDVETIVAGMAASMGSVLLMGGTKGKRKALPDSEIMIHQPSGGIGMSKASDMKIAYEHMAQTKKRLLKLYQKHTGQTEKQLAIDMDRDHWMTPEEALKYHLIDEIVCPEEG